MARAKKKKAKISLGMAILLIIIGVVGYFVYTKFILPSTYIEAKGAISFHFITLGNGSSGDSIYVKAGDNDILIDAGSDQGSIDDIKNYVDRYVTDGKLEYVIVTHGDKDHIAGFSEEDGSIFDLYECGIIIDFPLTSKDTQMYDDYLSERADEVALGAKHYTALECYNNLNGAKREYDLSGDGNVKMQILYNYYYDHERGGADEENDYSVCLQFVHGSRKFLFTGDLEKKGEEYLVEYNDLSQVELYKAGHHGSATSTNEVLMSAVKPKICVVTCAIGDKHDFPRQEFINRISPYTDEVYVTTMANEEYTNGKDYVDMNGNIVVISDEEAVSVQCSNNQILLKDTEWFKENRLTPPAWAD